MTCFKRLTTLVILSAGYPAAAQSLSDTPPPGGHFKLEPAVHAKAETFKAGQPIVGTTYFYWYDVYSGAHIRDPDGTDALTTHPPLPLDDVSFRSTAWHYKQLQDVCAAGIDFIMPVYWGEPGRYDEWSFAGIPPLLKAHERMIAEHRRSKGGPLPPKIGLFYDTSTLMIGRYPQKKDGKIDLTTPGGRDWFYVTIRDFFSMIPPDKWARVDGKPVIFLYSGSFAAAIDDKLFEDMRARFKRDFATDVYLVRHSDWPGRADAWYQWGGALGIQFGDHVAGLGPGYDHSAVPGRQRLVVDRDGGRFYSQQWQALLAMHPRQRPWIVHVETWNEWHEGTDIARSQEHGDQYIRATAKYAELFHAGKQVKPTGPFADAKQVSWSPDQSDGLQIGQSRGDGCWQARSVNGRNAVVSAASPEKRMSRYLYFDVAASYLFAPLDQAVTASVTFLDDGGCNAFRVDYDSTDPRSGPLDGAFRPTREIPVGNSGDWRTVQIRMPQVRFTNRVNFGDFRIGVVGGNESLTVAEIVVRKVVAEEPQSAAPRSSMEAMQVAAVQLATKPDLGDNTKAIIEHLKTEASRGTRLVVFPECALTTYETDIIRTLTGERIAAALGQIRDACRRFDIYAVVGAADPRGGKWYNAAFVIGPTGEIVKRYDKRHCVKPEFFTDGDALAIFRIDDVPATIMICHDERYPEIFRIPVLAGARVGIYISCESKTDKKWDNYRSQIMARAVENQIAVVHANAGDGGADGGSHGHSRIIDPRGNVLAEASTAPGEVIRATIHPSESSDGHAQRGADTPSLRAFWAEGLRVLREQNPDYFK